MTTTMKPTPMEIVKQWNTWVNLATGAIEGNKPLNDFVRTARKPERSIARRAYLFVTAQNMKKNGQWK